MSQPGVNSPDSLTTWIQTVYESFIPTQEEQMEAQKRLQGTGNFKYSPDANHPLQLWAKKLNDSLFGTSQTEARQPTPFETYLPMILLGLAVWLVFGSKS